MHIAETLLVVSALLAIAVIAAGFARYLPVPYTVLLVVIGMVLGAFAGPEGALAPLAHFRLTPDLVLFVFLPVLIFESAFNLSARQLLKDIGPILTLAVPALLISTAVIGFGLWALAGVALPTALLFGALISATDPVAVVALFKELGTPLRLNVLVEGESLMNDATAIVVFKILLAIALTGSLGWGQAGESVVNFVVVFVGGALAGAAIGAVAGEIVHRLRSDSVSMLLMSFAMAYASFAAAETVHVSGVMAVAAAALVFSATSLARASQAVLASIREVWEVAATAANALLFLLMGLSIRLPALVGDAWLILLAVALMLVGRALPIYTLVPATTRLFRLPRVSTGEMHIMWWGGLRGGLAIAIAISVPETLPGRELIQHLALGAVLFTLLVNAPSIRPVIRALGIDRMTDEERGELREGLEHARREADAALERFGAMNLISRRGRAQVRTRLDAVLLDDAPQIGQRAQLRYAQLRAIRAEFETLNTLHEAGVIQSYTYLDMRNLLVHDREAQAGTAGASHHGGAAHNPFLWLELELIRRLREHDWAAGLLARYQGLRLTQRLRRDIAGVMTAQAGIDSIASAEGLSATERDTLAGVYRERLARRRQRIQGVRREFPEFYRMHEAQLWEQVALRRALAHSQRGFHHGEIGAKAFAQIEQRIAQALHALARASRRVPAPEPRELLAAVPLFAGLGEQTLARIAAHARPVTYLPGDVVIEEGAKGDALYVVVRGQLGVHRTQDGAPGPAAIHLHDEDFFGEAGLLGDAVRTATVKAETPCTLLRLARADVLAVANDEPEVLARLEAARSARSGEPAPAATPPPVGVAEAPGGDPARR